MANEEHLKILRQGVEVWNQWISQKISRSIDLCEAKNQGIDLGFPELDGVDFRRANLAKIDLRGANLKGSNFSNSNLVGADFRHANLSQSNLCEAALYGADFEYATLSHSDLRKAKLGLTNFRFATLREVNFSDASLVRANLFCTDLTKANLNGVNLCEANLNASILSEASLLEADLSAVQALNTNFTAAKFTGACIGSWNINSSTRLDEVDCQYIYLYKSFDDEIVERRPCDSNTYFAPGEFTKLYEKVRQTVDLIFINGIDWQAFLISFQQLQIEVGDNVLSIQAIENKGDGAFVIRVNLPAELDKAEIEKSFKRKFQIVLKAKEKEYRKYLRERLVDKDNLIDNYREQTTLIRQENTQLLGIIKTMAEKENSKYHFYQPQIGNFIDTAQSGSRQQSINNQHNYASEQKQTLSEAATEIQNLLKQLEQTNPAATETQQIKHINDETTPNFKKRVIGALQASSETAIDEFILENKYLKVAKAAIKGWMISE